MFVVFATVTCIQHLKHHTLRVSHSFLFGFVVTQCSSYLLYFLGVLHPPIALGLSEPTMELTMLIEIIAVTVVFISYRVSLSLRSYLTHRMKCRPPRRRSIALYHRALEYALWLVSIAFAVWCLLLLIRTVLIASLLNRPLTNMELRRSLASLGPLVILQNVQLGLLLKTYNSFLKREAGIARLLFCALLSLPGAILVGQRSAFVIPIIMLALNRYNYKRSRSSGLELMGAVLVCTAIIMFYTMNFKVGTWSRSPLGLLKDIYARDFETIWTLFYAVDTCQRGLTIVPYPGAGFVNALLSFVPRSIAPSKGVRSAIWFTYSVCSFTGIPLGSDTLTGMSWAFKLSFLTELVINWGVPIALLLCPIYGVLLSWLDTCSRKYESSYGATLLAGFYLWWLDLFAIITGVGTIIFTCILLNSGGNLRPNVNVRPELVHK